MQGSKQHCQLLFRQHVCSTRHRDCLLNDRSSSRAKAALEIEPPTWNYKAVLLSTCKFWTAPLLWWYRYFLFNFYALVKGNAYNAQSADKLSCAMWALDSQRSDWGNIVSCQICGAFATHTTEVVPILYNISCSGVAMWTLAWFGWVHSHDIMW